MSKYEESKTFRIMMATVPHVTSGLGLRKFQADGFLLTQVYIDVYTHDLTRSQTPLCTFTHTLYSTYKHLHVPHIPVSILAEVSIRYAPYRAATFK